MEIHKEISEQLKKPTSMADDPKPIKKYGWDKVFDNSSVISAVNKDLGIGVSRLIAIIDPNKLVPSKDGFNVVMSSTSDKRIIISCIDDRVLNEEFGYTHLLTIAKPYSHSKNDSDKVHAYGRSGVAVSMGLWGLNPKTKKDKIGVYWGPINEGAFQDVCLNHILPDAFRYIRSFESLKK